MAGLIGIMAILLIYLPFTLPRLLGCQVLVITSGSMEPQIPVGSLIYVQEVSDPAVLQPGEVITFHSGLDGTLEEDTITHRIKENDIQNEQLITQGDANTMTDLHPVPYHMLLGVVKKHLPLWGNFALVLNTFWGRVFSVGVLVFSVGCYMLGGRFRENR